MVVLLVTTTADLPLYKYSTFPFKSGSPDSPDPLPLKREFHFNFISIPEFFSPLCNFNEAMSEVRVSVECLFGNIINSFKFVDYQKTLKIEFSTVGKMYVVCALPRNAMTCLYKNQASLYFQLDRPILKNTSSELKRQF